MCKLFLRNCNTILWEARAILKIVLGCRRYEIKTNKPDIKSCVFLSITFHNLQVIFHLSLTGFLVEKCLPALFYIICGFTAEQSFAPIISSNVSLCSMTFCYGWKLPSKVIFARAWPSKIHSIGHHNKKLFSM